MVPNGLLPNAEVDWPKAEVDSTLRDRVIEKEPNIGVVETPSDGMLVAPNAGVPEEPNTGLPEAPIAPPDPNTGVIETENAGLDVELEVGVLVTLMARLLIASEAGMLTSKVGVGMAPIAGVFVALNESMVVTLKAGELLAPDAD